MATVDKNFKVKHGLIVEGTTATVNGEDIITTGSSTDNLPEGSTNKYYSTTQAKSDAIDLLTNATLNNITITADGTDLTITAENGGIQNGDNASLNTLELTSNGNGDNLQVGDDAYIGDVNLGDTINIQGIENNDRGFVSFGQNGSLIDNSGQKLNYVGFNGSDLQVVSSGDIVLNADGTAYLGSVTAGNAVATQSDIDTAVNGLAPNYVTSVGANLNVTDGELTIDEAGIASDLAGTRLYTDGTTLNVDGEGLYDDFVSNGMATTSDISTAISNAAGNYDAAGAASGVQSNLDDHISDTSTHGVTGDIVGTSDAQSLSNKTFLGQVNFQSGGGAGGTNNHINVNNSTGKMTIESGYSLDLKSDGTVSIVSNANDIILNADGAAYITSATSGNEIATQGYVDSAVSNKTEIDDNVTSTTATWSSNKIDSEISTAVGNVVGMAPEALNTLEELAQAFDNSPDTLSNLIETVGGKQDALTAGTHIDITGTTISVTGLSSSDISDFNTAALSATSSAYDASGAADTAEQNAKDYADNNFVNVTDLPGQLGDYVLLTEKGADNGVATLDGDGQVPLNQLGNVPANYITSVGTNLSVDAGELTIAGNPSFEEVNIADVVKQIATRNTGMTSGMSGIVARINLDTYTAGKFTVKVDIGTDTEISEILLTTDSSNNIAITEYGIVGTNGSLSTISASVSGGQVLLQVNPTATADVTVVGTLLV